jgi:hypothetical protein
MNDFFTPTANLTIPLFVESDFGVDDDGKVSIVTFVEINDEDNLIEVQHSLEQIMTDLLDYWQHSDPSEAISVLSTLAHALNEAAERCWDMVTEVESYRVEHEAEQYPEL